MKKFVWLLLAVLVLNTMFCVPVFAAKPAASFSVGAFDYHILDGSPKAVEVLNFSASATAEEKTNVVFPDKVTYNNVEYTVYKIYYAAFANATSIVSVEMPDTIVLMSINAFYGCKNLESVKLSASLVGAADTEILQGTFYACSKLETVEIPASVKKMTKTFVDCKALKSVIINGVDTIIADDGGVGVFDGCNPELVISAPVGAKAISYAKAHGIATREIGEAPPFVPTDTTFESGDFRYSVISGTNTVMVECLSSTSSKSGSLTLPSKVKYNDVEYTVVQIKSEAFANETKITEFIMADTVTTVGKNLFSGCAELVNVHLSDSLTNSSASGQLDSTFVNCKSLKTVIIPEGIKCLPKTFNGSGIENVVLKARSTEIPKGANNEYIPFSNPETVRVYYRYDHGVTGGYKSYILNYLIYDGNIAYEQNGDSELTVTGILPGYEASQTITIPSTVGALSVTAIADDAFSNNNGQDVMPIETVILPDSVTSVGKNAFKGCYNLSDITLPSVLTGVLDHTFEECMSLSEIVIPEGVTELNGTFLNCTGLSDVKLASTVATLSNKAFGGCSSLSEIWTPASVKTISDGENPAGSVFTKECKLLVEADSAALKYAIDNNIPYEIKTLFEYEIIDKKVKVKKINERILGNCIIPATVIEDGVSYPVTEIGSKVFDSQSGLTVVSVPDSVTSIADDAFYNCTNENFAVRVNSGAPAYAIVKGRDLSYIVDDAQSKLAYKKYKSESGFEIYSSANDSVLSGDIAIDAFDGTNVVSIGEGAFANQSGITSVTMANTIKSIGKYAFKDCSALTYADLSDNAEGVLDSVFVGCSSLTDIDIPQGITALRNTYNGCSSLVRVVIPQNITAIYENSFADCTALEVAIIPETVTFFDRILGFKDETQEEAEYVKTSSGKKWVDNPFKGATNENLIICAPRGSKAEEFAYSSGIKFVDISKANYYAEYTPVEDKTVSVTLRDIYGKGDVSLVCALYNQDGKMISVDCQKAEFDKTTYKTDFVFDSYTDDLICKLFVWNSLTDLVPCKESRLVKEPDKFKILIIGNSISNHGTSSDNGWYAPNKQGMAATCIEKDFAHLLEKYAKSRNKNAEIKIVTGWSLESSFDKWQSLIASEYQEAVNYDADLIIAQIGENVKNNGNEGSIGGDFDNPNAFTGTLFANMIKAFMKNGKDVPVIVVTSMMSNKDDVLTAKAKAASDNNWAYVNLCKNSEFEETSNGAYKLTDGQITEGIALGTFKSADSIGSGVFAHPGNNGMRAIANRIWQYAEPIIEEKTLN